MHKLFYEAVAFPQRHEEGQGASTTEPYHQVKLNANGNLRHLATVVLTEIVVSCN